MNEKQLIREEMIAKRKMLNSDFVEDASKEAFSLFVSEYNCFNANKKIDCVLLYSDFNNEIKTTLFATWFKKHKIKVCYPVIKDNSMYAAIPSSEMTEKVWGILQPGVNSLIVDPSNIDLAIIPGIAFDNFKNRLGFGKGYYDKYLTNSNAYKIGLAYDFQILDKCLPFNRYDISMDVVITEKEIIY